MKIPQTVVAPRLRALALALVGLGLSLAGGCGVGQTGGESDDVDRQAATAPNYRWIKCIKSGGCRIDAATDLAHPGFFGIFPQWTPQDSAVMGVFVSSGNKMVVSYPMPDQGRKVQIASWSWNDWAAAPAPATISPPPNGLHGTSVRCNLPAGCEVWQTSGRQLENRGSVMAIVPCGYGPMGVHATDSAEHKSVVSYPMSDRNDEVQVAPTGGNVWLANAVPACAPPVTQQPAVCEMIGYNPNHEHYFHKFCTGTLIGGNKLLTAKHCVPTVEQPQWGWGRVGVRCSGDPTVYLVNLANPKAEHPTMDVAVIRLNSSPWATLPLKDDPFGLQTLNAVTFRGHDLQATYSGLQAPCIKCSKDGTMQNDGAFNAAGVVPGDSGGPVMHDGSVIGVLSTSSGGAAIYVSHQSFKDWLAGI